LFIRPLQRAMTTSESKNSVVGVRHEGIPEGKIESINGVETYISTPSIEYPEHKALLFLTNVFGIPLKENKVGFTWFWWLLIPTL